MVELVLKDENQRNKTLMFIETYSPWGKRVFKRIKRNLQFDLANLEKVDQETFVSMIKWLALQDGSCRKDMRDIPSLQFFDGKTLPCRRVPSVTVDGNLELVMRQSEWEQFCENHPEFKKYLFAENCQQMEPYPADEILSSLKTQYSKMFGKIYV